MARLLLGAGLVLALVPAIGRAAEPAPLPRPVPVYPRFDLTYLPEIGQGLLGLRPAEIVRHAKSPELKSIAALFMLLLGQMIPDADFDAAKFPDLADIEQCVWNLNLKITTPTPDAQGSFLFGWVTPCVIRTVQPFDWNDHVRKWFPKAAAKRIAGRSYVRIKIEHPAEKGEAPWLGSMAFFAPDERTLVIAAEDDMFELLDRLAEGKPAPTPPPGWDEVDREIAAFVLDTREERPLSGTFPPDYPWGKDLVKLIDSSETLACGLSVGERTTVKLVGTTKNIRCSRAAAKSLRRLFKAARQKLDDEEEGAMKSFALEIIEKTAVKIDGPRYRLTASADRNVLELLSALLHGPD